MKAILLQEFALINRDNKLWETIRQDSSEVESSQFREEFYFYLNIYWWQSVAGKSDMEEGVSVPVIKPENLIYFLLSSLTVPAISEENSEKKLQPMKQYPDIYKTFMSRIIII